MKRILAAALAACAMLAPAYCAAGAELKVGDTPPDMVGLNGAEEPVLLKDHAGKAVVISFWATWCPYCLKELPVLNGIRKAGKGKIDVIAINTEDRDTFRRVTRVLKAMDLQFAYDPDHEAQDAYGVDGIPHMVIIGRDGKIAGIYRGYGESSLPEIVDAINRATGAIK